MGNGHSADYASLNAADKGQETDPFTLERYAQFERYLPAEVTVVLDVGCSTGRGGRVLKARRPGLSILGLDCVAERTGALPKDVYASGLVSYSTAIHLEDQRVDAVIAGEFIEHLTEDDVEQTLREFHRVLRQSGTLLLTTPNPGYLRLKLTGRSVIGGAHLSQHRPQDLERRLVRLGFVHMQTKGSGKLTRFLGEAVPFLALYGSYLLVARKRVPA